MQQKIEIGDYVYIAELRNHFEFTFYLDRLQSRVVFENHLDPFKFGEYHVDYEYKINDHQCPNPLRLKTALIEFILHTVKRKRLRTFAFTWNQQVKQNLYLLAAHKIKNKLGNYRYYADFTRGLIVFVKMDV